jgi:hypothetical protein
MRIAFFAMVISLSVCGSKNRLQGLDELLLVPIVSAQETATLSIDQAQEYNYVLICQNHRLMLSVLDTLHSFVWKVCNSTHELTWYHQAVYFYILAY